MPSPKDKDSIIFGVDAEEEGPDKSLLGDIYKQKDDPLVEPTRFDVNQVQPVFVEDQWGTWLTANSPIRSNTGDSVGVVGVDIDAKRVIEELKMLRTLGFLPCSCPLF
jgi:hypothetical protein